MSYSLGTPAPPPTIDLEEMAERERQRLASMTPAERARAWWSSDSNKLSAVTYGLAGLAAYALWRKLR